MTLVNRRGVGQLKAVARLPDWVELVERSYRLDGDDDAWLAQLVDVAHPFLDHGLGVVALLYDVNVDGMPLSLRVAARGRLADDPSMLGKMGQGVGPDAVREFLAHPGYSSVSEMKPETVPEQQAKAGPDDDGLRDWVQVNARDPSGVGCLFGAFAPDFVSTTRAARATWSHVCAHMGAAMRLRRASASLSARADGLPALAEAVLEPSGRVAHAEGAATVKSAREALREAARTVSRARDEARREDPRAALEAWRALVSGRWSLVDHFDSDGHRYLVAHKNPPKVRDPRRLTRREQEVLAFLALGSPNKLIGYTLGLSTSRVGTLIGSAARKLGCSSRVELVALARQLARAADVDPEA